MLCQVCKRGFGRDFLGQRPGGDFRSFKLLYSNSLIFSSQRSFYLPHNLRVVIDCLIHRFDERSIEPLPYSLVALDFGGGEPEPSEQVYVVANAHEQGVLGRDRVGQRKTYDVGQIPAG
jgi:hypothetical protein